MQSVDPISLFIAFAVVGVQVSAFVIAVRSARRLATAFTGYPTILEVFEGADADDSPGGAHARQPPFSFRILEPDIPRGLTGEFALRCNQALDGVTDIAQQLAICRTVAERLAGRLERRMAAFVGLPVYLGLVGTFAGIINGLIGISVRSGFSESSIQQFLAGVFVAMAASLAGVSLMVIASALIVPRATSAAEAGMADYLGALESSVRKRARIWADAASTTVPAAASVDPLAHLPGTLEQFTSSFSRDVATLREVVQGLTTATEPQRALLVAVQKLDLAAVAQANTQLLAGTRRLIDGFTTFQQPLTQLNQAMAGSQELVAGVTSLLDRVTRFERSIQGLGDKLAHDSTLTGEVVELVRRQIAAIQDRTDVIQQYANQQDEQVKAFATQHREKVENIATQASQTLADIGDRMAYELEQSADPAKIGRLLDNVNTLPGILGEVSKAAVSSDGVAQQLLQLNSNLAILTDGLTRAIQKLDAIDQSRMTRTLRRWATRFLPSAES